MNKNLEPSEYTTIVNACEFYKYELDKIVKAMGKPKEGTNHLEREKFYAKEYRNCCRVIIKLKERGYE